MSDIKDAAEEKVDVEVTRRDAAVEIIDRMAAKGLFATLLVFRASDGSVEAFSDHDDLKAFASWFANVWAPCCETNPAGESDRGH